MSTREAWLLGAAASLSGTLRELGAEVPPVRVSFGFPKGSHGRSRAIGQCWQGVAVADGVPAIFISPELADPARILDVLLHELVHAATPGCGHRKGFSTLARAAGLVKPWTATKASPELATRLTALAEQLGPLDHSRVAQGAPGGPKKQSTRMLKLSCASCGYTVRTTRKWIEVGYPSCPDGDTMEWEV